MSKSLQIKLYAVAIFFIANAFHCELLVYNDNIILSYSIGSQYSCYINNNYKMKCFGYNVEKQLGLGDDDQHKGDGINEMGSNLAYVDPGTIDNAKFKSVFCGSGHTCSILTNEKAKCWGYKFLDN